MQKDPDNSESNATLRERNVSINWGPRNSLSALSTISTGTISFFMSLSQARRFLDRGWLDSFHAQLPWGLGKIDRRHRHDQVTTKGGSA